MHLCLLQCAPCNVLRANLYAVQVRRRELCKLRGVRLSASLTSTMKVGSYYFTSNYITTGKTFPQKVDFFLRNLPIRSKHAHVFFKPKKVQMDS